MSLPYLDVATTADTARFWAELAAGRVTIPWCRTCDTHVWFPKPLCPACMTAVEGERTLSGEGVVYSYSIVHRGPERFTADGPYVLAYVSLDGGPTVLSNIVGDDGLAVAIGDRVRLVAPEEPGAVGAFRFERVEGDSGPSEHSAGAVRRGSETTS